MEIPSPDLVADGAADVTLKHRVDILKILQARLEEDLLGRRCVGRGRTGSEAGSSGKFCFRCGIFWSGGGLGCSPFPGARLYGRDMKIVR
jgi:hypothetical protein